MKLILDKTDLRRNIDINDISLKSFRIPSLAIYMSNIIIYEDEDKIITFKNKYGSTGIINKEKIIKHEKYVNNLKNFNIRN